MFVRFRAFTIIEMLVTLIVLGILLSMVMFVSRSAIDRSDRAGATAAADRVIQAQQVVSKSYGQYTPYPNDLIAVGSDIRLLHGPANATNVKDVSFRVSSDGMLGVAAGYKNGRCVYYLVDPLVSGGNRTEVTKPTNTICNGAEVFDPADPPAADSGPSGSLKDQ